MVENGVDFNVWKGQRETSQVEAPTSVTTFAFMGRLSTGRRSIC
jgi:hypothetical protein